MFSYDPQILAALPAAPQSPPNSIDDAVATMQAIDALCEDADGLKWFNWLYLAVTQAVGARVSLESFADPAWMASLDVHFAGLYFSALRAQLSGAAPPECWKLFFDRRNFTPLARIQFALAGINAHINHDLAIAIVNTGVAPVHGDAHYRDYTALNTTLDSLVAAAKQTLNVRLLGDALPPVSQLEETLAAFSVAAARETAWTNAEILWSLRGVPPLYSRALDGLNGFTSVIAKGLLIAVRV
jgi:Family of unknown function (DUF5995)